MIFLAYNFLNYKFLTEDNLNYRKFVLDAVQKYFPNEDYLLPYSQYSRADLVKKLDCADSLLTGRFNEDLPHMVSHCNKLVFFTLENYYIGTGVFFEIATAKKANKPCYGYNLETSQFSPSYEFQKTEFVSDEIFTNIFYKKVKFCSDIS